MTAGHVAEGCRVVRVAGDGFEGQVAKVVAIDQGDDLALLRVDRRPASSLKVAKDGWGDSEKAIRAVIKKQEFGQGTTIGFPGVSGSPVIENVTLPPNFQTWDLKHFYRVADGLFVQGQSGSPILYQNGEVAGVVSLLDPQQWIGKTKDGSWEGKGGVFVPGPVVEAFVLRDGVQMAVGEPAGNPVEAVVHIFCFTGLPSW